MKETTPPLQTMLNSTPERVFVLDSKGRILAVNHLGAKLVELDRDRVVGKNFAEILALTRKSTSILKDMLAKTAKRVIVLSFELEGNRPEGKQLWVEANAGRVEYRGKSAMMLVLRDITDRKLAEDQFRQSEQRYRMLLEYAPYVIYAISGEDGIIASLSPAFERITGWSVDEWIGKSFALLIHPDDLGLALETTRSILRGEAIPPYELRILAKSGKYLDAEFTSVPLTVGGKVVAEYGVARDITERKLAEKAVQKSEENLRLYSEHLEELVQERTRELRESEERYRRVLELDPNAVVVHSEGKVVFMNPAGAKLLGGEAPADFIGKPVTGLVHPHSRAVVEDRLWQVATLSPVPLPFVEEEIVRQDGKTIHVEASSVPITFKGKGAVLTVGRDITQRKLIEERLLKAERLAAIGELSAMVGHDMRNPLTGLTSAAYYLKTRYGSAFDEKGKEMLEIIDKDVHYANRILSDLLEFSREITLHTSETTPRVITENALSMAPPPKNVTVSNLSAITPSIRVDADKLTRVFVNIIRNAFDAMPEGGQLTVTSNEVDGDVEIAFSDTGAGMTRETLDRIWSPLFTTKAKGVGLGLPIAKRLTEAHDGSIRAEAHVGGGATFTVRLPIKPREDTQEKRIAWKSVQ